MFFLCFYCFLGRQKEGKNGRFALNKGRTRRGRMATKDRALGKIELTAARIVDDGMLLHRHSALLCQEGLFTIVDEYVHARIVGKDHVRCLRGVDENIGVVDEIDIGAEPRIRQIPCGGKRKVDGHEGAARKKLAEFRVLFGQNGIPFLHVLGNALGRGHGGHPIFGLLDNGLDHALVLNGFVRQHVEYLADAAILLRWIVPAIDAINGVQPEGHRLLGKEVAEHLQCRARLDVNRIAIRRPVLLRRRVVINAVHGERARLQPLLALTEIEAHVDHENMRVLDLAHGRHARAGRRNGMHLDRAGLRELEVGNEGREPAVNAVAVEENGVVGHGIRRVANRVD